MDRNHPQSPQVEEKKGRGNHILLLVLAAWLLAYLFAAQQQGPG